MTTDPNEAASPESEEAVWELATAERLRTQGDLAGAASWYRRAAEHLMDAGDDDQALEVAKKAGELAAIETVAAPSVPVVAPSVPVAALPSPPAVSVAAPPPPPSAPPAAVIAPTPPEPVFKIEAPTAPPTTVAPPPTPAFMAPVARSVPAPRPPSVPAPLPTPPSAVPVGPSATSTAPLHPVRTSGRRARAYVPARMTEAEHLAAKLPSLPLFGELPGESIRALARQVTLVRFAPGQVIADGASCDGPLLVLTDGDAEAKASDDQPGVPLGAGDFAGELSAYYGGSRVVTVVAQSKVEAVALTPTVVRATARDFESFREALEEAVWEWAFAALPWVSSLLRRVEPEARTTVFDRFERVHLREGDLLQGEGVKPGAVWLIAAGEVEVYGGELGAMSGVYARAGDALGVGAVLADEVSGVSARAVRGVLAARITADAFRAMVNEEPALGIAVGDIGMAGRGVVS